MCSCVSRYNPEIDPARPSAADRSTSHFSRERTKGTPNPGVRRDRARWLDYLVRLSVRDGRRPIGISRARQKAESRVLREFGWPLKRLLERELPVIIADDSGR